MQYVSSDPLIPGNSGFNLAPAVTSYKKKIWVTSHFKGTCIIDLFRLGIMQPTWGRPGYSALHNSLPIQLITGLEIGIFVMEGPTL